MSRAVERHIPRVTLQCFERKVRLVRNGIPKDDGWEQGSTRGFHTLCAMRSTDRFFFFLHLNLYPATVLLNRQGAAGLCRSYVKV